MSDKIVQFPGVVPPGDGYKLHHTLKEALRQSARHGFEREMNSLFEKYAVPSIAGDPLAKGSFLDAGLLFASANHYLEGHSWKDSFLAVTQAVTSKPDAERPEAVVEILARYQIEIKETREIWPKLRKLKE